MPDVLSSTAAAMHQRDWIAALDKGLGLLEAFGDEWPRMSATQAGQRCGMTRTAARRHLLTLAHLGYLATDGKMFWITPKVLRLGQSYLESARLPRLVQPYLQRVVEGTREHAYVSVLDGYEVVYIAHQGPTRAMGTGYVLGARVPAQVTGAGMLLLAAQDDAFLKQWLDTQPLRTFTSHTIATRERIERELARIRQQGWALSDNQLELNFRGVAVALRDRRGAVVAALSITMPIGQESGENAVKRVLGVLLENAQTLRNLL